MSKSKIRFMERELLSLKAFTLAEVLITLGIIGTVAAMTIPTLLSNVEKDKYRNQFKNIYSELTQANKMMQTDGIFPLAADTTDPWPNYMKLKKTCTDSTAQGCFHTNGNWYNTCGTALTSSGPDPGFITTRGELVINLFSEDVPATVPNGFNLNGATLRTRTYLIDVNGFKKPNKLGKDIFAINMFAGTVMPVGSPPLATLPNAGAGNTCPSTCTGGDWRTGFACAYKVVNNIDY